MIKGKKKKKDTEKKLFALSSMDVKPIHSKSKSEDNLKLAVAIAIALTKSKLSSSSSSSDDSSDAHRWRRKAKERKLQISILKQQIKQIQDGLQCDPFPEIATCKCHFFDDCANFNGKQPFSGGLEADRRINDFLHRRFLRQVRWRERQKKADDCFKRQRLYLDIYVDDEIERLSTSMDFLVELCDTRSPAANHASFATLSHQAVDFILATLKNLLSNEKDLELLEEIICCFIGRLIRRMCTSSDSGESTDSSYDIQACVQHLLRKLGSEPYIGQYTMLLVSQRLSAVADSMLLMDPFDDAFPNFHGCMFMMIQLIEFLISDYTKTWTKDEFNKELLQQWVRSIIQVQKVLTVYESRNGLYMICMDRLIGEFLKQMGLVSHNGFFDMDILADLFH